MSEVIQAKLKCPFCPSSDAYFIYDDGHGYCFSCKAYSKGDVLLEDTKEHTYEYLNWRGVTADTYRFYGVKTKISGRGLPVSVGFTYPGGATKVRILDRKDFYWVGSSSPSLFGLDKFALGADKSIIITEGELDACSAWQITHIPSVSVRSASSAAADVGAVRQQLNSYERIYLAFDADAPGRQATADVAKLFEHGRVYDLRLTHRKDANEFLEHGEGDDFLNLFHNAKLYVPDTITSSLADFKRILETLPPKGVPYPFPTLTKMTYGLRTGEVVLLKAPEKVGKTALMHEFLRNLLERTDDNVAAIFLEEPRHRLLQSLAGLEIGKPAHLPDSGCTVHDVYSAITRLVKKDNRLHIYNNFGSVDPKSFLDTIRYLVTACRCRYVLFDHISMACGVRPGEDERKALEYLGTELEAMTKELDFGLIMVSHVNDFGQTRGSHYLTKLADITIDANRNTLAVDEQERRLIHLSIPFNRFCSSTGVAGDILFDPLTYRLTEIPANENTPSTNYKRVA